MPNRDYDSMRALIESAKGRFCYIRFTKKDGTERKMIIQPAKLKFEVKGDDAPEHKQRAAKTWKENNPNLMPVWDVEAEGIRSINFDTVDVIHINKQEYRYG